MNDPASSDRTRVPVKPSNEERVRAAALKSFAAHGITATSLRMVAKDAGVSLGLVQHYYSTKAALIASVDEHVLRVVSDVITSEPLPGPPDDGLAEAGRRLVTLFAEHADVIDYVGHALVEGGEIGTTIFDGLLAVSSRQRDQFTEQGLASPDLDPLWAALNPLILRMGALILRPHIDRHLLEPFHTPSQLQRWDAAVTRLIRRGQITEESRRMISADEPWPR